MIVSGVRRVWPLVIAGSILGFSPGVHASACDQFVAESEAVEGVVPKLDDQGRVRALVMYGEGTFIAPKRSLIAEARRKAELRAKRAFSEWMQQDLSSESAYADMMETVEKTNQDGITEGTATEISQSIDVMRTNTSAVLSGIVKLDECVDTSQKFVLVEMGWKPSLSKAAGNAKATINSEVSRGNSASGSSTPKQASVSSNTKSKSVAQTGKVSTSKKGGITIVTVEVEGIGSNLKSATNEALRSAVAQVHGEAFASRQKSVDLVASIQATDSAGNSAGVAVEQSASLSEVSSSTSGLIESYEYLSKNDGSTGYRVVLRVNLPKYESSIDPSKNTIIVLPLKIAGGVSPAQASEVSGMIRDGVESLLGDSNGLAVLDRQNLGAQQRELDYLASGAAPISEMARMGNSAGADFMLIGEILSLNVSLDESQLAGKTIKRSVFDAEVSVKVIEVASTNIVYSRVLPFRRLKYKESTSQFDFSNEVAGTVARQVANRIGGGISSSRASDLPAQKSSAELKAEAKQATQSAKARIERMKQEAKKNDDW